MKKITIILFVLVALIQLAVPAYMVFKHENIVRSGTVYNFKTAPVDPYDAFRGRYVALNVEQARVKVSGNSFKRGETVYALVRNGADGFARITGVSKSIPAQGDYFKTTVRWGGTSLVTLNIPFGRFYMEEFKAPEAEKVYMRATRRNAKTTAWVAVRLKDGGAVIENLYVDGLTMAEYLKKHARRGK